MNQRYIDGRTVVVVLVIVLSTALYAVGLISSIESTPVEPQSVFTLYGTVLGYLFGSHEKKHDQAMEITKERES